MIRSPVLAFVSVLFSLSISAGSVRLEWKCRNGESCAVAGKVRLQSVAGGVVEKELDLSAGSVVVDGADVAEWDVALQAPGFWSPVQRIVIPAGQVQERRSVPVWRTGHVRARIRTNGEAPGAVRVVVTTPPDARYSGEIDGGTSFGCTSSAGPWLCEVPAARLDLAFRTDGYAPEYRWDVSVPAGQMVDVGDVVLKKGASLVAWLDSGTASGLTQPARAILRRESSAEPSATAIRLAQPVAEGVYSKKGVVQLAPLAPGRYVLETRAAGYATSRVPVEVLSGRESTVRHPIELARSTKIHVRLTPPLAPDGARWAVEMWRQTNIGSGSEPAGKGNASEEGIFVADDQAVGPVRILVKDARGNVLTNREIVIAGGADTEYPLAIDLNAVGGIVKFGATPLANARLLFGGSGGKEKVRVKADPEGRFSVTLPRRGKWIVDVLEESSEVSATTEVTLDEMDHELEIVLPETELSGWVVDGKGNRFPSAEVLALSEGRPQSRRAAADGTFRFRGLPAGAVRIRATDPRTTAYSTTVSLELPQGKLEGVELKVEELRKIAGLVTAAGMPVVGARVHAYAFLGGAAQQERRVTDLEGRFELAIPASSTVVTFVVGAAGRTLHAFRLPADKSLSLDIAPRGGRLRLRYPQAANPVRVTFNDTAAIPFSDLADWARAQQSPREDGSLLVPDVAAGKYRLCVQDRCAEGMLGVGGSLDLDVVPSR